jgi:transposase
VKHINDRYKAYLDAAPDWIEGRRALVAYARAHGVPAAARMSGATPRTVRQLIKAAESGRLGRRGELRPPSREDEERILAARRAHPDYGPRRLKKLCGLQYDLRKISRVIHKHGLPRLKKAKYDPAFRLECAERRIGYARTALAVEEILAKVGVTGFTPRVERVRKDIERYERIAKFWRGRLGGAANARDDTA